MNIGQNKWAILWSGIDKVNTYVVNFSIQIVLARLLCPEDYAVVAMLAIFFSISQAFIDSGFATTLIQRQDCSQRDFSSVFYFNIFIGLAVYGVLFAYAPFIERYYEFPNLSKVTKVYFLTLLIGSFSMVHRVILTKRLQFKKIALTSFFSALISAVPAIVMAYKGYGYWALVAQSIVSSLLSCVFMMHYSKWRPTWEFSFDSLRRLAPFGLRVLVVYLFHAIYNNIYSLLIGKRFTAQELGYYDRGKTLSSMGPVGFSDFYTRALYPIQAKCQNDNVMLYDTYKRSFALICYLIVPFSVFMLVFSEEVVMTLFGDQWLQSAWILSILCVGYMLYPLQALNMNMLKVKGRADWLLRSEIIKKTMGIVVVFVAAYFDLRVVVYGWTLCAIMEFIISEVFYWKLCRFPLKDSVNVFFLTVGISIFLALGNLCSIERFCQKSVYAVFLRRRMLCPWLFIRYA